MSTSSTVTAELGIRLVVPQQAVVPLLASFHYTTADPYAIRVSFHVGLDEPVVWIFARELLSDGMAGRTGAGDVRVWPSATAGVLEIELSSPFGRAHFEAPADEVASFLDRTYRISPVGQEGMHVDVEAALADLLGRL
jgi:hypothetical protein